MPTSTTESMSVIECFSGRVSEYAVATARYASSTEWLRSRRTPSHRAGGRPARRRMVRTRYQAMKITMLHPMPMSRRLAPVMFASASEHGDSVPPPTGGHEGPYACTEFPPFDANTKSTAYSGSTAISASSAMARPAEMSSCATSAAHDSRNAAPTIARPNSTASRGCDSSEWRTRMATPGTVAAKASVSARRDRPACTSSVGSMSHPTNASPTSPQVVAACHNAAPWSGSDSPSRSS